MQASDIPYKFSVGPGSSADPSFLTDPVPATASGAVASQALLFPPATAQVTGTPPTIQDMNGLLFYSLAWANWMQAGGPVAWDATFSSDFGGYPKGAVVQSGTTFPTFWLCTADNNTTDPDTGGGNWIKLFPSPRGTELFGSSGSFTVPNSVFWIQIEGWAGAGGGGASGGAGAAGAGGGGGSYGVTSLAVVPGQTISFTVGAGGTAGSGSGNGGAGGTTTVGGMILAGGTGGGGSASGGSTSPGSGGTGGGASNGFTQSGGLAGPGMVFTGGEIGGSAGGSVFFAATPLSNGSGGNGAIGWGGCGGAAGAGGGIGGTGAVRFTW